MPPDTEYRASFPEMVYPSLRDAPVKNAHVWLKGKRMDDGAEGLWRIYNNLYDFTDFISNHPGGEFWLKITKGTDITEAFESHHLSTVPETIIKKYFIRRAVTKRNSPFVFEPNGFYKTLKRRAKDALDKVPKDLNSSSKGISDGLTLAMYAFAIGACFMTSTWTKILMCLLSGLSVAWNVVVAHNFLHQKDNWRMYLFNFSYINTKEFRVTHALSHHQFPNTLMDLEISVFEPMIQWLPRKTKSFLVRFGPIVYNVFIYTFLFVIVGIYRTIFRFKNPKESMVGLEDLLPLTMPLIMYIVGAKTLSETLVLWLVIVCVSSFIFSSIGVNAAHHHPDIFHDGDAPKKDRDWGIHQLHAVMDRTDINGSHFKVLTHFGEHGLHHLFPTLDHACLPYIQEVFIETCKEFNTELRLTTQLDLVIGAFKQLARVDYKKTA